jgi:ubiquitin C-terminal hydrolase
MVTNEWKELINTEKPESELLIEWNSLTRKLWEANTVVNPTPFHRRVQLIARKKGYHEFTGFGQNDSQEFLQFFLENLHNSLSIEVSMNIHGSAKSEFDNYALAALKQWKTYFESDYSPIVKMYYGQLFSIIRSNTDKTFKTISYDPFSSLSLEIPPLPTGSTEISLYDCLNHFTHPETIEFKQNSDDTDTYFRQIMFWKLPDHLVIFFKRFDNRGRKIMTNIKFPIENLDMTPYFMKYEKVSTVYDLYGIANHEGGLRGGHYFAYCKNIDGKWYKFNDQRVSIKPESELISPLAYCLFYRRKET